MSSDAQEASDDRRKYEFRKVIEELRDFEGSGTQLVTIYIPEDRRVSDVVAHVTQEHSEASNIKSKQTRTAVQDALTSIKDRLRYYDTFPPENGMVIFSGAIDAGGGQTDMVTRTLESPPQPVESFRYHCDSAFLTEPLEHMLEDSGLFGLIVLDRREANVGWLKGKRVEPVKSASSLVPGKQRKGASPHSGSPASAWRPSTTSTRRSRGWPTTCSSTSATSLTVSSSAAPRRRKTSSRRRLSPPRASGQGARQVRRGVHRRVGLKDLVDNASEALAADRRSSRTNATWTSSSRTSIPARRPRTASIRPVEI